MREQFTSDTNCDAIRQYPILIKWLSKWNIQSSSVVSEGWMGAIQSSLENDRNEPSSEECVLLPPWAVGHDTGGGGEVAAVEVNDGLGVNTKRCSVYKGKERCEYYLSRPSLLTACFSLKEPKLDIQTFVGGLQTFYYIDRAVGNLLALPVWKDSARFHTEAVLDWEPSSARRNQWDYLWRRAFFDDARCCFSLWYWME